MQSPTNGDNKHINSINNKNNKTAWVKTQSVFCSVP